METQRAKRKSIRGRSRQFSEAEAILSITDRRNDMVKFTFNPVTKELKILDAIKSLQDQMYGATYDVTYIEDIAIFRDKQIEKILK